MPAKNLYRIDEDGIYSHIYNRGIENKRIFNDEEDYEIFLGFLKEYLTLQDPNSQKTTFNVKGRIFHGIPHQPKNYFNKIELIAYNLLPDHFHLILYQKESGSIEKLLRSLSTRYSIYFNKKYQRNGPLFAGPYKSIKIESGLPLAHLSRYLHQASNYSSYQEYLNQKNTNWIKPEAILNLFNNQHLAYKAFVENKQPDENSFLESITLDDKVDLEKSIPQPNTIPASKTADEIHQNISTSLHLKPWQRIPELAGTVVIFSLLVGIGLTNIEVSATKNSSPKLITTNINVQPSPNIEDQMAVILGETIEASPGAVIETIPSEGTSETKVKRVMVKVEDGSLRINVRQEPKTNSKIIAKTKAGDIFELVSKQSEWYEVNLSDGTTGFISDKYIEEGEAN